jgi:hypothetical protein
MLSRAIRHTSRGLQGIPARGFATSIAVPSVLSGLL